MHQLGLIGFPLSHSFSKGYFTEKFGALGIEKSFNYELFPIDTIEKLPDLLNSLGEDLLGLNVTIPYKQVVMKYLDVLDEAAQKIGAVNCICVQNGKLIGYNTDYWGFRWTLEQWLAFNEKKPQSALVLGKGGAAKAVVVALKDLGLKVQYVSRKKEEDTITYEELNANVLSEYQLIVNTSPLGMYPSHETLPNIPYELITESHLAYDLVYNPLKTKFLKTMEGKGAAIHTGLEMLHGQAEKAWEIWQKAIGYSKNS